MKANIYAPLNKWHRYNQDHLNMVMAARQERAKQNTQTNFKSVSDCINFLEKDEYGLYKNAENYNSVRNKIIETIKTK